VEAEMSGRTYTQPSVVEIGGLAEMTAGYPTTKFTGYTHDGIYPAIKVKNHKGTHTLFTVGSS
jgi:hypothetical protein